MSCLALSSCLRPPPPSEAIKFVNARPKPLALYLYSTDKAAQEAVLTQTSSGGASINECMMHFGIKTFPFGGVGASGMGGYHGQFSFDTFTHKKGPSCRLCVCVGGGASCGRRRKKKLWVWLVKS